MEFARASISCHCAALFTLTLLAFWSTKGSAEWIWLAPKSGPRANVIRACKIKAMAALQLWVKLCMETMAIKRTESAASDAPRKAEETEHV